MNKIAGTKKNNLERVEKETQKEKNRGAKNANI